MSRTRLILVIPALALMLSACNTTEALTSQVDVGHGGPQSTPVTQGDLDQMAAAADRAPAGSPATATSVPSYAPQNTLQAQAQAQAGETLLKVVDERIELSGVCRAAGDAAAALVEQLQGGIALGQLLHELLAQVPVTRVILCGGDTSSHAVQQLSLSALTWQASLQPGAPLCRAHFVTTAKRSLEVILKGGQIGSEDFFNIARGCG